jgi:hypothetical protein
MNWFIQFLTHLWRTLTMAEDEKDETKVPPPTDVPRAPSGLTGKPPPEGFDPKAEPEEPEPEPEPHKE